MKARFFTDITCPWAWQSSRWFKKIEEELKIPTTWELFSLAIKNKSLNHDIDDLYDLFLADMTNQFWAKYKKPKVKK